MELKVELFSTDRSSEITAMNVYPILIKPQANLGMDGIVITVLLVSLFVGSTSVISLAVFRYKSFSTSDLRPEHLGLVFYQLALRRLKFLLP